MAGCWEPCPGKMKASIGGLTMRGLLAFHNSRKFPSGNAMPVREDGLSVTVRMRQGREVRSGPTPGWWNGIHGALKLRCP